MGMKLGTKLAIIIAVMIFFIYGVVGPHSTAHGLKYSLKQTIADNIHLGLDLKGGSHLVLKVNVVEALNSATDRDVQRLQAALVTPGVTVSKTDPVGHPDVITISGIPAGQGSAVRAITSGTDYSTYDTANQPDGTIKLTMKPTAVTDLEDRVVATSIEVIRERIDSFGNKEPIVQPYGLGANEILIELPGVDDPGAIEDAIKATSKLAVYAVEGGPYESETAALAANNGVIPPDDQLLHGKATPTTPDQVWLLKRASEVEGTDFRDAQPSTDINGRPNLHFTLTTEAGDRFFKYTTAHSRESQTPGSMAIVLGKEVKEVASINSAIRDQGEIEGTFSEQEVANLSLMLRTGALPASVEYIETRTVGPSLGAASIHQGVVAAIAGMAAVMIFMLIYYKGSGINADLALLLNLIILLGYMGYSGATLTLPGIAGVILTIGMGVDSNVLIFERIREELRAGKTAAAAVKEGFGHAWTTIVDTHVTTIVSAGILIIFGTGPVKGFAVTLIVGLMANLITAVFVSRMIFDWHLQGKDRTAELSI
jgi:preprotein translocase subunit SecD